MSWLECYSFFEVSAALHCKTTMSRAKNGYFYQTSGSRNGHNEQYYRMDMTPTFRTDVLFPCSGSNSIPRSMKQVVRSLIKGTAVRRVTPTGLSVNKRVSILISMQNVELSPRNRRKPSHFEVRARIRPSRSIWHAIQKHMLSLFCGFRVKEHASKPSKGPHQMVTSLRMRANYYDFQSVALATNPPG